MQSPLEQGLDPGGKSAERVWDVQSDQNTAPNAAPSAAWSASVQLPDGPENQINCAVTNQPLLIIYQMQLFMSTLVHFWLNVF